MRVHEWVMHALDTPCASKRRKSGFFLFSLTPILCRWAVECRLQGPVEEKRVPLAGRYQPINGS